MWSTGPRPVEPFRSGSSRDAPALDALADVRVSAPTEIAVPTRTYPTGYTVTCDGCTHVPVEGGLRVTKTPPGAITLTLTPR